MRLLLSVDERQTAANVTSRTTDGAVAELGAGFLTVKSPNDTVPTNFRRETPLAAMFATVVADYSDGLWRWR